MTRLFYLYLTTLLFCSPALSQTKDVEQREMTWLGYFNQTRFTKRSGLWFDGHLRLDDYVKATNTVILRAGYVYYFSDQARLSAGYGFISQPGANGVPDAAEHRPWQQLQWFEKKSWFSMSQYLRAEQRYRKIGDSDHSFLSHRVRYNISLTFPLTGKETIAGTPFVFASNELFINAGKNIINNYFDQNRFFVGLGYQFTRKLNAQLGYLNVFQQLSAGNKYINSDAVRFFVFHNLDFRAGSE